MGNNWFFIEWNPDKKEEIINLLKSFRGKDELGFLENDLILDQSKKYYLYIDPSDNLIKTVNNSNLGYKTSRNTNHICLTIENFYNKYPFRVNDEVRFNMSRGIIRELKWNKDIGEVRYVVRGYKHKSDLGIARACELKLVTRSSDAVISSITEDTKITFPDKLLPKIDFSEYTKFRYKINLGNYRLEEDNNGNLWAVRKSLTETFEDCCEVLGIDKNNLNVCCRDDYQLMNDFLHLKICRDAFWKVLNYAPNWKDNSVKYVVQFNLGNLQRSTAIVNSRFLAFPTAESREDFIRCFESLILKCKELL